MVKVWKIAPGNKASNWESCRQRGYIAIGLSRIKDFSVFPTKDKLQRKLEQTAKGTEDEGKNQSNAANQIWSFLKDVQPTHVVVANKGKRGVVGIGVVTSGYLKPDDPQNPSDHEWWRHTRLVDWLVQQDIEFDEDIFVQDTVKLLDPPEHKQDRKIRIRQAYLEKYKGDLELKAKLDKLLPVDGTDDNGARGQNPGVIMRQLLEQFRQIIVHGPPGTGKTREAKRVALALLSGRSPEAISQDDKIIGEELEPHRKAERFDLVMFHPAYEYEQFVGGIVPREQRRDKSSLFKPCQASSCGSAGGRKKTRANLSC